MSKVTVVGFTNEDEEVEFVRRVSDATLKALLALHAAPERSEQAPVVKACRLQSPRRQFGPKGDDFSAVYCLNDAAVSMCEDLKLALQVIGVMDEMPVEVSYDLEAHYLPTEEQSE